MLWDRLSPPCRNKSSPAKAGGHVSYRMSLHHPGYPSRVPWHTLGISVRRSSGVVHVPLEALIHTPDGQTVGRDREGTGGFERGSFGHDRTSGQL